MKIKTKLLERAIKKASLNGCIYSVRLLFKEDGIHMTQMDKASVALTKTFIPLDIIDEYEKMDTLYIRNTSAFVTYLKTMDAIITLSRLSENVLEVKSEKRKLKVILGSKESCDEFYDRELPNTGKTISLSIEKLHLANALKDMKFTNETRIRLSTTNTTFSLTIGKENETDVIETNLTIDEKPSQSLTIGDFFGHCVNSLDKDEIVIKAEKPKAKSRKPIEVPQKIVKKVKKSLK